MKWNNFNIYGLLGAAGLLLAGCSTLPETQVRELNRMADNAVAKMVLEQPGLQAALGAAAGAIAFEWSASGIPIVGKRGVGVLMESSGSERTPVIITQLEINGAQGLGSYIGVLTIKDSESFQRAKTERLSMENAGTIYIYVKGEASASYAVKRITIEPQSR